MNGRHFPFLLYWEHKRAREENQEEKENMSILEVNHLKKIYTTRFSGNQVQALSNLSFSVEEGEYVAIMGESGSGKTTLLNILAALDKPTGGEVLLNGKNIVEINEKEISAFRRENLGFVFQDFNLLDNFSLKDNILLPLVLSGVRYPEMEKRLHPITKRLGIEELLEKYPYEVSGGQKQRIALARALLSPAKILILDEATSNLDMITEKKILKNLLALDKTIIFIAHRLSVAEMSHRIIVIEQGKVIESGSHSELLAQNGFYAQLYHN